jgi:kinetochor protein Mis14/NSL1
LPPTPEIVKAMLSNSTYGNASIEEHEPFDPRLWEKAKELARQEEDLIEEIATLRRKMPSVAVESVKSVYKESMEDDERMLNGVAERVKEERGDLGLGELARREDVEAGWRRGIRGLEGLKGSLPEYVAKAERAAKAEEYVVSTQGK